MIRKLERMFHEKGILKISHGYIEIREDKGIVKYWVEGEEHHLAFSSLNMEEGTFLFFKKNGSLLII